MLFPVVFIFFYQKGFCHFLESQLYSKLLEDYQPLERPVANSSHPVNVRMGVVLQQIISVDEKNQVVDVNAWLKLTWNDYSLHWDPSEYNGVNDLRFRKGQIWTPDVLMYNSADPKFDTSFSSNLLVYSDGMVNWMPPGIFRLSCRIEIVWFPFDIQRCFMKFGSWTFDGTKLDLEVDENGFDISNYIPNGEWSLVSASVARNIQFYQCCPEPYYDLMFTFVIRRRVVYYAFNLILPCILIAVLTLIGFILPPDAGEKMSLQVTIMLSICIFQNYVAEISPPTSEAVPFLGAFFAVCMFTCACCVVATALALNFHNRNNKSHEMNSMFRLIMLNWLPWLLLMHRPGHVARKATMTKEESSEDESGNTDICLISLLSSISVESYVDTPRIMQLNEECEPVSSSDPRSSRHHLWKNSSNTVPRMAIMNSSKVSHGHIAQLLILQQIYSHLTAINHHIREKDAAKAVEDDWKFSAMVVDRLCLFIFSFFILISTVALFASIPNLSEFF